MAMTRVEVDGKTLKEDEVDGWSFTSNQRVADDRGRAVLDRVEARLQGFAELRHEFGKAGDEHDNEHAQD